MVDATSTVQPDEGRHGRSTWSVMDKVTHQSDTKWLKGEFQERNPLIAKGVLRIVDNPYLGTGFTVRAAWFPT